ncbi:MAG TPA: NUDIX domain-containing protein [Dehalococcoidia bacterium]|nr:NUDIX domain-containing protein [Dehalococcoidia bacterium]
MAETRPGEQRHFTATGFVVEGSRTLLLWHQRLGMWVPPGGHIDANEDPVTAVLREVREETGIEAELVPNGRAFSFSYPEQVQAPYTILVEDISGPGEPHKHIDFIYFCRPVNGSCPQPRPDLALCWVEEETLRSNDPVELAACGVSAPIAEDVRLLALEAIDAARRAGEG